MQINWINAGVIPTVIIPQKTKSAHITSGDEASAPPMLKAQIENNEATKRQSKQNRLDFIGVPPSKLKTHSIAIQTGPSVSFAR